nr:hypothetical protein [Pseudomonadota bacterium]
MQQNEKRESSWYSWIENIFSPAQLTLDQDVLTEINVFAAGLRTLLALQYTPADLSFCNGHRPDWYIPLQLQTLINGQHGFTRELKAELKKVIAQWQPITNESVECEFIVDISKSSEQDIAAQLLKAAGENMSRCRSLIIHVEYVVGVDYAAQLHRYLAIALSLSLAERVTIDCPGLTAGSDVTSLLLVANVFCVECTLFPVQNYRFQVDVLARLYRLKKVDGFNSLNTINVALKNHYLELNNRFGDRLIKTVADLQNSSSRDGLIVSINAITLVLKQTTIVSDRTQYFHQFRLRALITCFSFEELENDLRYFEMFLQSSIAYELTDSIRLTCRDLLNRLVLNTLNQGGDAILRLREYC